MRKALLPIALLFLLQAPMLFAAEFKLGEDYFLPKDETVKGDLYAASVNTTIAGEVGGDLFVAGATVFVGETVEGDSFLVGGKVNSLANIGDDLRIVSPEALVRGRIGEDLVVLSGELKVLPESVIGGDLYFAGGKITLDGEVRGKVKIAAGVVSINGPIKGDVEITADELNLGPNTVISRNLNYASPRPAVIDEQARVQGVIDFREIKTRPRAEKFIPTFWGVFFLVKFLVLLVGALVLHGIFRRISDRFVATGTDHFWKSLLWGFIFLVAVPAAVILVALTFIGIPFVLIGISVYIFTLAVAIFYSPVLIGSLVYRFIKKEKSVLVTWKIIFLGVVLVSLLDYIKYAGTAVRFIFLLAALGSIVTVIAHKFREVR